MDTGRPPDSMDAMTGLYELIFATLDGDGTLQGLLGATSGDRKIYPVTDLGAASLPAIGMSIWSDKSDVGHPIARPTLDLTISSKLSAAEVVSIATRVEDLLDRKRLAGSGRVIHLASLQYGHDDFAPEVQEFTRNARYALIAQ
jgi:hypothetical protein